MSAKISAVVAVTIATVIAVEYQRETTRHHTKQKADYAALEEQAALNRTLPNFPRDPYKPLPPYVYLANGTGIPDPLSFLRHLEAPGDPLHPSERLRGGVYDFRAHEIFDLRAFILDDGNAARDVRNAATSRAYAEFLRTQ